MCLIATMSTVTFSIRRITLWENPWPGLELKSYRSGPEMMFYGPRDVWYMTSVSSTHYRTNVFHCAQGPKTHTRTAFTDSTGDEAHCDYNRTVHTSLMHHAQRPRRMALPVIRLPAARKAGMQRVAEQVLAPGLVVQFGALSTLNAAFHVAYAAHWIAVAE